VVLNGVPVGKVDRVSIAPENSQAGAIVKLEVDRQFAPLRQGTHADIRPKGLLGVMYVQLTPGTGGVLGRGGSIPLQDTSAPVTLDQVNDIFDPATREKAHTATVQGGVAFAGRGGDVSTLLQQLPAISQDAADISAQLARRDQQLDALAVEFDKVAKMMADESASLKADLANGGELLKTLAKHEAQLQQELVYASSALAKLNAALGGHERDLNQIFKEMPALLDDLKSFQSHSATALGIVAPCTGDILATLGEMQGAMNYKTPGGSTDGQGYELRTYAQNVGPVTGNPAPTQAQYPCAGTKP
jgi:phospholipid/cholesterol/gamma-HCH transport system substrate-binding protein